MLTDEEITKLAKVKAYQKKLSTGTKGLITDLINSGKGDFKPDVSFAIKAIHIFVKARTIRNELNLCSGKLLERILNRSLQWPRTPESVRVICEADVEHFIWMRYDEPRVKALLGRVRDLIADADYRVLVKSHSSLNGEQVKDNRLLQIAGEIDRLLIMTLQSIGTRGVFDELIRLQSDQFYRDNEDAIRNRFLSSSKGGAHGLLPEKTERDKNATDNEP
jgi:hypothetical protein